MAFGEPNSYNVAWNGQVKSRDAAAWRRDERRNDGGHRSSENTIEGYYQSVETHPNLARGQGIRDRESGAR